MKLRRGDSIIARVLGCRKMQEFAISARKCDARWSGLAFPFSEHLLTGL